jgi:hypothetical protein
MRINHNLWVPQVRGPHEQVFVRWVEISILRPGKAQQRTNHCHPEQARPPQRTNEAKNPKLLLPFLTQE